MTFLPCIRLACAFWAALAMTTFLVFSVLYLFHGWLDYPDKKACEYAWTSTLVTFGVVFVSACMIYVWNNGL